MVNNCNLESSFWSLLGGKEELELIMNARCFYFRPGYTRQFVDFLDITAGFYYGRSGKFFNRGHIKFHLESSSNFLILTKIETRKGWGFNIWKKARIPVVDLVTARGEPANLLNAGNEDKAISYLQAAISEITGYSIRPWG